MLGAALDGGRGHLNSLGRADAVPQAVGAEDHKVVSRDDDLALRREGSVRRSPRGKSKERRGAGGGGCVGGWGEEPRVDGGPATFRGQDVPKGRSRGDREEGRCEREEGRCEREEGWCEREGQG
eukprot:scaffold12212_cov122-Isochrysis_galbana.AAC.6